eukprot:CAMPEP_0177678688 /NCGR_PEP_ID=MMETSP0447-20121125/29144_1 /TAXON_ID=0 /ORGANISM="Stygamoeba regulata, Strain BSH-02190019" /LENGTH=402 /DNA_ID=CAMNT_0019187711 /DNA_START=118 /DNA_END=1329 /DNA_ORIENTATION=-
MSGFSLGSSSTGSAPSTPSSSTGGFSLGKSTAGLGFDLGGVGASTSSSSLGSSLGSTSGLSLGGSSTPLGGSSGLSLGGSSLGSLGSGGGSSLGSLGSLGGGGSSLGSLGGGGSSLGSLGSLGGSSAFGSAPTLSSLGGSYNSRPSWMGGSTQAPTAGLGGYAQVQLRTPEEALGTICGAYDPNSRLCRFRHMFYNVVNPTDVDRFAKPENTNDVLWIQAMKDNPDPSRLVPVQATGFGDLKSRIAAQEEMTGQQQQALDEIGKYISKLQQQHELTTTVKIEEFRRKHMELAHRVLQLMVKIEVLQARGYSILTDEETYRAKLENLQQELNKPTQFKSQVRELTSLVRMQEDTAVETYEPLDEQSMRGIYKFLSSQQEALARLSQVLKEDAHDLEIITNALK